MSAKKSCCNTFGANHDDNHVQRQHTNKTILFQHREGRVAPSCMGDVLFWLCNPGTCIIMVLCTPSLLVHAIMCAVLLVVHVVVTLVEGLMYSPCFPYKLHATVLATTTTCTTIRHPIAFHVFFSHIFSPSTSHPQFFILQFSLSIHCIQAACMDHNGYAIQHTTLLIIIIAIIAACHSQ